MCEHDSRVISGNLAWATGKDQPELVTFYFADGKSVIPLVTVNRLILENALRMVTPGSSFFLDPPTSDTPTGEDISPDAVVGV